MYREETMKKYARLVAGAGINTQKDQLMVISTPVECAEFARLVMEELYRAGARDVVLRYSDEKANRIRFAQASPQALADVPAWKVLPMVDCGEKGAGFISIVAEDPDAYAGIDPGKIGAAMNAEKHAKESFYEMLDRGENQWTVVAAAAPGWAKKLFPQLGEQEAVERLWDAIFHTMRLDCPDPAAAWEEHSGTLAEHCRRLNDSGIRTLVFQNSLGTDLTLELAEGNLWAGGAEDTVGGVTFQANMPTEEVFTMPHRARVNGRVVSSMPLNYQGMLIENFAITFRDGRVEDYTAEKGREALEQLLAADEGCRRLGEVALVPFRSLIRETGLLFYNTLFDENASCHLALGSAYPVNMKGCLEMTREERTAKGFNESVSHVDFMFGTADLSIDGITQSGERLPVFRDGNWA